VGDGIVVVVVIVEISEVVVVYWSTRVFVLVGATESVVDSTNVLVEKLVTLIV